MRGRVGLYGEDFNTCVGGEDGMGVYMILCEALWLHIFTYSHDTFSPWTH